MFRFLDSSEYSNYLFIIFTMFISFLLNCSGKRKVSKKIKIFLNTTIIFCYFYYVHFFLFLAIKRERNEPKKVHYLLIKMKNINKRNSVKPFCTFRHSSTAKEGKTRFIKRAFKAFVRKFLSTGLSKFSSNAKKL